MHVSKKLCVVCGRWVLNVYFLFVVVFWFFQVHRTPLGYETSDLNKMVSTSDIEPVVTFLMILWRSYEYLMHYQSEESCAH